MLGVPAGAEAADAERSHGQARPTGAGAELALVDENGMAIHYSASTHAALDHARRHFAQSSRASGCTSVIWRAASGCINSALRRGPGCRHNNSIAVSMSDASRRSAVMPSRSRSPPARLRNAGRASHSRATVDVREFAGGGRLPAPRSDRRAPGDTKPRSRRRRCMAHNARAAYPFVTPVAMMNTRPDFDLAHVPTRRTTSPGSYFHSSASVTSWMAASSPDISAV